LLTKVTEGEPQSSGKHARLFDISDESKTQADLIGLFSFQRSGSSLLTAYFEKVTGIYVGRDMAEDEDVSIGQQSWSRIADPRVHIVNSHCPIDCSFWPNNIFEI